MQKPAVFTRLAGIQMKKWKVVVGPDIGPTPPSKYTLTQGLPWLPNAIELDVTGIPGKYCDWLIGTSLPLPPNLGANVIESTISFQLAEGYEKAAQAIEFDDLVTDVNGITHNQSTQWDLSKSATEMTFDVVNASGGWTPSGLVLPKFTAAVDHVISKQVQFNPTTKKSSLLQVVVDGLVFAVPVALQNVAGEARGWAKAEIIPQAQQDVNTTGGSWTECIKDWFYDCW